MSGHPGVIRPIGTAINAGLHYIDLNAAVADATYVALFWNAAVAFTATVESCGFPEDVIPLNSTTTGHWHDESDIADVIVVAGNQDGTRRNFGNNAAPRLRLRINVTTPGQLGVAVYGKST